PRRELLLRVSCWTPWAKHLTQTKSSSAARCEGGPPSAGGESKCNISAPSAMSQVTKKSEHRKTRKPEHPNTRTPELRNTASWAVAGLPPPQAAPRTDRRAAPPR